MGRRFESNHEVLHKHTRALAIIRNQLGDTVKARSSGTICSIMVLMITQVCPFPLYRDQNLRSASSLWIQLSAPR